MSDGDRCPRCGSAEISYGGGHAACCRSCGLIGDQDDFEVRYTARFEPQAWANDNAVDVDPEGPTEWDVTDAMAFLAAHYRAALIATIGRDGEALDRDDRLVAGPSTPEWVRNWRGPFSLWVREREAN